MIEHVRTIGFKGFDLDEDIPEKVIYCGKNKSGKSTRAAAIAIVIYGYLPFLDVGKKPGNILDSFGFKSLIVAAKINGIEFARRFSRNAKGGVTQTLQIDKKTKSSDEFAIKLNEAGAPKIADTADFMKQSEAKKIDTLFELFPNDTLSNIDTEIEEAKEDVSKWQKKKTGVESVIQRLTESKTNIELPSGSIAEIKAEIKEIDDQIIDYEKKINEAEIEKARIEGGEKEKERAKNEGISKDDALNLIKNMSPSETTGQVIHQSNDHAFIDNEYPEINDRFQSNKTPFGVNADPIESIKRIIGALTGSGCNTCAALIVAKQELKKHGGSNE